MTWLLAYATGVERIDAQHKALVQMVDDYRIALTDGCTADAFTLMLDSLDEYARAHFAFEETCMERYRCPVAPMNAAAHRRFTATLQMFRDRARTMGVERQIARDFAAFLEYWVTTHLLMIDTGLLPCVETAGRKQESP